MRMLSRFIDCEAMSPGVQWPPCQHGVHGRLTCGLPVSEDAEVKTSLNSPAAFFTREPRRALS
jgi:hypothetical protein